MKQEAFDKKCYELILQGFSSVEIAEELKSNTRKVHKSLTREFSRRQQMLAYKRQRGSRNTETVKLDRVKGVYFGAPGKEFEDELEYSIKFMPTNYVRLSPQEKLLFLSLK